MLRVPQWAAGCIFLLLALLVFAPIKCLYPSKTVQFKRLSLTLSAIWATMLFVVLLDPDHPNAALVLASLLYPVYYFGMSFWLQFGRPALGSPP